MRTRSSISPSQTDAPSRGVQEPIGPNGGAHVVGLPGCHGGGGSRCGPAVGASHHAPTATRVRGLRVTNVLTTTTGRSGVSLAVQVPHRERVLLRIPRQPCHYPCGAGVHAGAELSREAAGLPRRGASTQRASENRTRPVPTEVPSAESAHLSGEEPGPPPACDVVSATRRVSRCGWLRRC